jgi:outer membrane protein assembly factor BamD (BamD/ComL family)
VTAILLAGLLLQDWEYRPGAGFVNLETMEQKSPAEFLAHALELRKKERHGEAIQALGLILVHVPDPALRESAHYERAETYRAGARYFEAYHDFEAFIRRYPQSERATEAKRMAMTSALELARAGHTTAIVFSSSKAGVEYLREALRNYPREDFSSDFVQKLGMFYYERGDWDLADEEFKKVLDQYGDTPDAVLALYMLGRTAEIRFDRVDKDIKPLKDARRHYERFVEEADRMRGLPAPAQGWVDRLLPLVQERLGWVYDRMLEKQLLVAEYYDWKGLPKSARVFYVSILKDDASFRKVLPKYPANEAARKARRRLDEIGK